MPAILYVALFSVSRIWADPPSKVYTRVYPKVSGLSHNELHAYKNKQSLRSNTKGYGGKTHCTDS